MYEGGKVKKYVGDFKNNKPNGEGKLYHFGCEAVMYDGSWIDGCPSGQGRLFNSSGIIVKEGKF